MFNMRALMNPLCAEEKSENVFAALARASHRAYTSLPMHLCRALAALLFSMLCAPACQDVSVAQIPDADAISDADASDASDATVTESPAVSDVQDTDAD
jgi:hypothetical protein